MTLEEIIAMAREAGISGPEPARQGFKMYANPQRLERFAALVAAREREECAKVCDTVMQEEFAEANNPVRTPFGKDLAKAGGCMAFNLAKDIRARSKTC